MSHSIALPAVAAAALGLAATAPIATKPCTGQTSGPMLEELLPRVQAALDLPGTDQVAIDQTRRCIAVQVRTAGTARLIKLLLRGMDVPREAVEFRIVEVTPARGA